MHATLPQAPFAPQRTEQSVPAQATEPHFPPAPQMIWQLLASMQSTDWHDEGSWQSTVHGIPAGHCTLEPQLAPTEQKIVQRPALSHEPPGIVHSCSHVS